MADETAADETLADETVGETGADDARVGYRQPPKAHRFRKGQSGNPRGRPKRARGPGTPFLDEIVRLEIGGKRTKVRRGAWFFQQLRRMSDDQRIARMLLEADGRIERAKRQHKVQCTTFTVEKEDEWICSLGIARKLYPYARTARIVLEPWVVEAALERWEGPELTGEEQAEVTKATRCPHRVRWPDWWLPELRGKPRKAARRG